MKIAIPLLFLSASCLAPPTSLSAFLPPPPASLVVNGSFENRTSPPPPASGFSSGVPDSWVDILAGNTYLVHESHNTVPGNSAITGEIIVGGARDILLSQTITTVNTGPLEISWWANNEFVETAGSNNFHDSAVQFWSADRNTFIDWTGLRDSSNPNGLVWVNHTHTTSEVFSPGTYTAELFVGGRTSADNLVVTQSQIPEPTGLAFFALATIGAMVRRRR